MTAGLLGTESPGSTADCSPGEVGRWRSAGVLARDHAASPVYGLRRSLTLAILPVW